MVGSHGGKNPTRRICVLSKLFSRGGVRPGQSHDVQGAICRERKYSEDVERYFSEYIIRSSNN